MHGFNNPISLFIPQLASTFTFCGKLSSPWPLIFGRLTFWLCVWGALLVVFLSVDDSGVNGFDECSGVDDLMERTFLSVFKTFVLPLVLILWYSNFLFKYIKYWQVSHQLSQWSYPLYWNNNPHRALLCNILSWILSNFFLIQCSNILVPTLKN